MDKKISIIFFLFDMHSGGVQKSFVNLAKIIKDKYDITLFLFNKSGVFLKDIPESVKIITPSSWISSFGKSQKETKGLVHKMFRAFIAVLCRVFNSYSILPCLLRGVKLPQFDVAVSYLQNPSSKDVRWGCNYLALAARANKKMAFIHCDLKETDILDKYTLNEYKKFDFVFSVSKFSQDILLSRGINKSFLFYNPVDEENILKLSLEQFNDIKHNTFVTVSRLSKEKGIDRIIEICEKLEKHNIEYRWSLIGGSNLFGQYAQIIKNKNIKCLNLLGEKQNPYPYIKKSDYLVIASSQECAPMVIDEARTLSVKILSTRFNAASEFLDEHEICDNTVDGLYNSILKILNANKSEQKTEIKKENNESRIRGFVEAIESTKKGDE